MAKSRQGKRSNRSRNPRDYRGNQDTRKMREYSEDRSDTKRSSLNDISWYSKNPNLLAAAGSFPYPYRPGMTIPYWNKTGTQKAMPPYLPGVLSIEWIPSFGNSTLPTDPASIAGKEFYGRVREVYSGSIEADAPDFMVYIGALDSIFTYLGWLKRVYRTLTTYSPENFTLPDGIMQAMRFSESASVQLRKDKVRFWQGINELILKSRKFTCPAVMDLFNRHYWMSDNMYADAPEVRAQFYLFNVVGVYKLALQSEASAGEPVMGLQMTELPRFSSAGSTDHYVCDTLITFGDELLQQLDAWDDGYLISGYLMRAFKDVPTFQVAELLQNEVLTAQYVPEVLTQIENCRPINMVSNALTYSEYFPEIKVTQNVATNAVVSNVNSKKATIGNVYVNKVTALGFGQPLVQPTISLRSEVPGVQDNVIATRLHCVVQTTGATGFTVVAGTEIALRMNMVMLWPDGSWQSGEVNWINFYAIPDGDTTINSIISHRTFVIQQFDWHPIQFLFAYDTNVGYSLTPMSDIHNITIITTEQLANLHKICFYSELNSFEIQ